MKRLPGLGTLVLWTILVSAFPSYAQTDAAKTPYTSAEPSAAHTNAVREPFVSLKYDISQEVKLSGTVTEVVAQPSAGMLMGSHLNLQTRSGNVDAQLGRLPLTGRDAVSVAPGERVQVTGVIKTINNKTVLLTRLIEVDGQVYELRNEHGIYRPHPERAPISEAAAAAGSKGGTR